MHVVVIGSGLLGVSTAYFLNQHGIEVTVVDREQQPARGASYGNGGYLQTSAPDPWNSPGIFKMFLQAWTNSLKGRGDTSAFAAPTSALPGLVGWGLRFLGNANSDVFQRNLIGNFHLAQYSKRVLEALSEAESLSYHQSSAGSLIVFRSEQSMNGYTPITHHVGQHGARFEIMDRESLIKQEPALADVRDDLVGAVHYPDDSAGNSRLYCEQMVNVSRERGVSYRFGFDVKNLRVQGGRVLIRGEEDEISADAVVIAAGARAKQMAASVGIKLPIAPAKGFSVSIPMNNHATQPKHVIADMGIHAGVNPLGDTLRVAGTAEFSGLTEGISAARTDYLIDLARQLFPTLVQSVDRTEIDPWGGHRPLSVDGLPMIGASNVPRVYVNAGHGGLGWTQAAGSGKALADQIARVSDGFSLDNYSPLRFNS